VGVCIIDPGRRKVLLGRERFGKYRGKFNLCAGSVEPEDDGCAVAAAQRELREEFKLALNWDRCFSLQSRRSFRVVMVGPTPVFVGKLPLEEVDPQVLTHHMQASILDERLPGTHKEMEAAAWFPVPLPPNADGVWSRFARAAVHKVDQRLGLGLGLARPAM
jgi:8-oxo-dGTP pyrophosphatase MutT (NUDIX family)